MMLALRLVPAVLLALLLTGLAAAPASAHAILRSTSPADGDVLDAPPETVSLEFNEPVSTSKGGVRVFNGEGERVDQSDATAAAETDSVSVSLPSDLPDGTYVVSWRALSADSHPVHGAFIYTVGEPSVDDTIISEILTGNSDGPWQIAAAILRFLQYSAGLLAAGGVFFLVWIHDRRSDERNRLVNVVMIAAGIAGIATVLGLGVQGALVSGLGLRGAVSPATLDEVMASGYGVSTAASLIGLIVLAFGARKMWEDWAVTLAVVGAVILLGSYALTGHTASSQPRWLVMTSDVVHTAAGAAWFGGLVLLLMVLRRRRVEDDAVGGAGLVSRFSTMATTAIVAVSLAGTALGWAEVRAVRALLSTGYGLTLIAKIALVGVILLVGAYNKRRLVPAIRAAGEKAWKRLATTVRFEVAGLCLVLGLTAVLVNLVPARDAAGVTGPLSVRGELGEEYLVDVTVDPNRAGVNEMHVYLFSADGRPAPAESILVGLSMPANDIGPIEREPTPTGPAHWTLSEAELPIAGRWIVTISASITRFDEVSTEIPIDVGG